MRSMNPRFVGTWLLDSYETLLTDGTLGRPWGDDPVGIIYWDASGYFAVQVGPREAGNAGDYISFFGTAQAPDGASGTIVLRVEGSSLPGRVNGDQVRDFLFLEPGLLRMRPPVAPNGVQSTFTWRRAPATGDQGQGSRS
jgi:hypothetical protein